MTETTHKYLTIKADGQYIWTGGYDTRALPKDAGFRWDPARRLWWTQAGDRAVRLAEYADEAAARALGSVLHSIRASSDTGVASPAAAPVVDDHPIPCPEGLAYLPYQIAGIRYAAGRTSTLIADEMGCIDGEAEIAVNRGGRGFRTTIAKAFKRFHGQDRMTYNWDLSIPTHVRALVHGEFRQHRLIDIVDKGIREVVSLTLASGKSLRLTPDHEVATRAPDGFVEWVEARNLTSASVVLSNGVPVCARCGSPDDLITYKYAKFNGWCRNCAYRHGRSKPTWVGGRFVDCDGYVRVSGNQDHPRANLSGQVYEHILVMEAHLGRRVDVKEEIHHVNGKRDDNRIDNLQLVTSSEHKRAHKAHLRLAGERMRFIPLEDRVVSVELDGEAHVYDLVMADPYRNFVANGIVVHNCGKTIQAIGVINSDPSIRTVLVVCPASLRLNWQRECEKWLTRPMSIRVCNDATPISDADQIVIVNDERIKGQHGKPLLDSLMGRTWDLLVVDEAHRLKNPKAQRTQLVLGQPPKRKGDPRNPGLLDRCRRRVLLTGTPLVNKPIELWPILNAVAPESFNSFWGFAKRYCDAREEWIGSGRWAKKVWKMDGASHLDELQIKMRATCMVRRLKRDVLRDLPAKRRQIVVLAPNGAARAVENERLVYAAQEEREIEIRAQIVLAEANDDKAAYEAAVAALHKAQQLEFSEISRVRHETAVAKIPHVVEYVDSALDTLENRKIVVFAHHHDVINGIIDGLGANRCVRIMGDDSSEARDAAVTRFQSDPTCEVIVGSIGAMGVGLTLTAASTVVFAELDWVPGNCTQAEDRLHRISQTLPVLVIHLVFDESIDARMAQVIVAKQAIADEALDLAPRKLTLPSGTVEAGSSVAKAGRNKDGEPRPTPTAEVRAAAAQAVMTIAGMCDGAQRLDGSGFNKLDARVGHSLAERAAVRTLTDGEVALACLLATKYRRQLGGEDVVQNLTAYATACGMFRGSKRGV